MTASTFNILDGMVEEIFSSKSSAVIAIDVKNGKQFYSYSNNGKSKRLDLKKGDRVKVIFRGNKNAFTPSEPEYKPYTLNFSWSKMKDPGEKIEILDTGYNSMAVNPQLSKTEWKTGNKAQEMVRSDDMIVLPLVWLLP